MASRALDAGEKGIRSLWDYSDNTVSNLANLVPGNVRTTNLPVIWVRVQGTSAEFSPAVYQVRREGEAWPERWNFSADLAGTMSALGLDSKWQYVSDAAKTYAYGESDTVPVRDFDLSNFIWPEGYVPNTWLVHLMC